MIKTGISGLRGTVAAGESSLTAIAVAQWVQAYVGEVQRVYNTTRPRIALGHDARRSSPALAAVARGALLLAGADVVDLGLTLTPTVQLAVRRDLLLDGGLMITASHNPVNWNGLKFVDTQGFFLPLSWWQAMEQRIADNDLPRVSLDHVGQVSAEGEQAWQWHLESALQAIPTTEIQHRHYCVVLDACNGGAVRWAEFLEAVGCEVVLLHSEQHGFFAREAEPLPIHLGALQALVRTAQCDLGLAADPDGDRLVLVDANGDPVSEEHTIVLAAMALSGTPENTVVVNVVTTHALEEMSPAQVIRTAVGEMNVVEGVTRHAALLGGEGSGGIIVPQVNMARDGLAAIGLILTLMATEGVALHELVARIPVWQSIKSKLMAVHSPDSLRSLFVNWQSQPPTFTLDAQTLQVQSARGNLTLAVDDTATITLTAQAEGLSSFRAEGQDAEVARLFQAVAQAEEQTLDLTDGVKIMGKGAWLSLRPSNTEPIVRVMGEVRA